MGIPGAGPEEKWEQAENALHERGIQGRPGQCYLFPMPKPSVGQGLHPWHDIPTGPEPPAVINAIIEIPTNERNKYELDKEIGIFRLDRVLASAVHYPGDYGFIPRTLGDDGDPLDVLVITTIPVFTGCLIECRPIGLFHLIDRGKADEKVLAVPVRDPYSDGVNGLDDLPKHSLKEIEHFFQVYKDLEGVTTRTRGFEGAEEARQAISEAMDLYRKKFRRPSTGRKR